MPSPPRPGQVYLPSRPAPGSISVIAVHLDWGRSLTEPGRRLRLAPRRGPQGGLQPTAPLSRRLTVLAQGMVGDAPTTSSRFDGGPQWHDPQEVRATEAGLYHGYEGGGSGSHGAVMSLDHGPQEP